MFKLTKRVKKHFSMLFAFHYSVLALLDIFDNVPQKMLKSLRLKVTMSSGGKMAS